MADSTAKLEGNTLARVQSLFERYEQEMLRSNYSTNPKSMRVGYVRHFVEWLAGKYSPGDYDGAAR